jgi:hypothetical protein
METFQKHFSYFSRVKRWGNGGPFGGRFGHGPVISPGFGGFGGRFGGGKSFVRIHSFHLTSSIFYILLFRQQGISIYQVLSANITFAFLTRMLPIQ